LDRCPSIRALNSGLGPRVLHALLRRRAAGQPTVSLAATYKEAHCDPLDPADHRKGDTWDHVAFDAESRLVLCVVPGERTAENVVAVVEDFRRRTGGRLMDLITTDGDSADEDAILAASGETITPPRTGKRGRPRAPYKVAPVGLT